ncbi:MAG: hypothetical protein R6W70_05055 [bacterium]
MKKTIFLLFIFVWTVSLYSKDSDTDKGFKLTDSTKLHTTAEVEMEYSSNITKASEDTVVNGKNIEATDDIIMHYKPGLRLKIDDSFKTLGMSILFDYNHYLGVTDDSTSSKYSTLNLSSEILGEWNKDAKAVVVVKNYLDRRSHPNSQVLQGIHSNLHERFKADFIFRNSQDTLLFKLTPAFDLNYYESRSLRGHNYMNIKGGFFGRWKFLPKTMFFINSSIVYRNFFESDFSKLENSYPVTVFGGFAGQITPRISAKISGGYTATMTNDNNHDFVMAAELVYKYSRNLLAKVGYVRSYFPTTHFQYYRKDKPYIGTDLRFFGKLLVSMKASYSYLNFGKDIRDDANVHFDPDNTPDTRTDHLLSISPSIQYNILEWLGTEVFYDFNLRKSDYSQEYEIEGDEGTTYNEKRYFNYVEHRILLNISLDY